jgi:hypothetical protein
MAGCICIASVQELDGMRGKYRSHMWRLNTHLLLLWAYLNSQVQTGNVQIHELYITLNHMCMRRNAYLECH